MLPMLTTQGIKLQTHTRRNPARGSLRELLHERTRTNLYAGQHLTTVSTESFNIAMIKIMGPTILTKYIDLLNTLSCQIPGRVASDNGSIVFGNPHPTQKSGLIIGKFRLRETH